MTGILLKIIPFNTKPIFMRETIDARGKWRSEWKVDCTFSPSSMARIKVMLALLRIYIYNFKCESRCQTCILSVNKTCKATPPPPFTYCYYQIKPSTESREFAVVSRSACGIVGIAPHGVESVDAHLAFTL